jgi:hypothetical protein
MKRFSFFEWTNVVVRERLHRNDYGKEKYDEDKINGPPKSSKDNDLKKLSRDQRSSNFSGTTSMTKTNVNN